MAPGTLTYSLCMPIELTRICAAACDFCPFPFTRRESLLSLHRVRSAVKQAQSLGATLIDLTAGEDLAEIPEIVHALHYYHLPTLIDYFNAAADTAQRPHGGPPIAVRLDAGPFPAQDWSQLRSRFQGAKLLLTTVDTDVAGTGALQKSPTQRPEYRLQSIIDAGATGMPLTTGTLVGIGESVASREKALRVLSQIASRYGHVQSVLIQAFHPHSATPMAEHRAVPLSEMLETVEIARRLLPAYIRVQINALDWRENLSDLVRAGATDLGDLSLRILAGHGRNAPMELALLLEPLKEAGHPLRVRSFPGSLRSSAGKPASGQRAPRPVHR